MARPVVRVAAVVVVASLGAAACGGAGRDSGSGSTGASGEAAVSDTLGEEGPPVDGGKLVFGLPADTDGWNPHRNRWAASGSFVGSSMFEPLAALDGDLNATPWLATDWTPSETFESWTIELRDGITFSNGEPLDAEAVKMNFDDVRTSPLSGVVFGKILGGAEVIDTNTVRVHVSQPLAAFPNSILAAGTSYMQAPAMIEAAGTDQPGDPIGTGPFTWASSQAGSNVRVVKNPNYWQDGLPHLDEIEFKVLTDASAMVSSLQASDLDIAFANAIAPATQMSDEFIVLKNWSSDPGVAVTNTNPEVDGKPNPMANEHARKALAYATDQQALAEFIGEGVETPTAPFPTDSKWGLPAEDDGYVSHDLDKAREEVAAYESDIGADLSVTLLTQATGDNAAIGQLLQSQWAEAGIDTTIESVESTALQSRVISGNYQISFLPIYSSPDPDQSYHFWSEGTAPGAGGLNINVTQYTSPELQKNIDIGREDPDFADRKAAYDAVVREINGAAVNIWTYATPCSIVSSSRVHGLAKAAEVPFCNYQPKTWLGELWISG